MQEIETTVTPDAVWESWEKAHGKLQAGEKGRAGEKGFQYQILAVEEGESFSILWKSFMTRLIFSHSVRPSGKGSRIQYGFQIKGPFAWPLRFLLEKKIQQNLALVLKATVRQLEEEKKALRK